MEFVFSVKIACDNQKTGVYMGVEIIGLEKDTDKIRI